MALTKEETLERAYTLVTGERNRTYGPPRKNLEITAQIWSAQLAHVLLRPLRPDEVAQLMVGLKLARLVESPDHADTWVDVAGYAAIGAEVATVKEEEES